MTPGRGESKKLGLVLLSRFGLCNAEFRPGNQSRVNPKGVSRWLWVHPRKGKSTRDPPTFYAKLLGSQVHAVREYLFECTNTSGNHSNAGKASFGLSGQVGSRAVWTTKVDVVVLTRDAYVDDVGGGRPRRRHFAEM